MMRCIIVDDEQLVRELLEDNIRQVPYLELAGSCRNAMEAAAILQARTADLIFLDIQMPRLNGIQFLRSLPEPPLVILVTAYEKYAVEGFDLHAVDYLLKPFSFERFLKACNRANDLFSMRQMSSVAGPGAAEDFFVNVEYQLVKIVVADIEYIEGLKDYVRIHLSASPKPVITRITIRALEEKLPPPGFIRTHKSYLVASRKITSIKRDLVCIGSKEIPLSEFYKENIDRLLHRTGK